MRPRIEIPINLRESVNRACLDRSMWITRWGFAGGEVPDDAMAAKQCSIAFTVSITGIPMSVTFNRVRPVKVAALKGDVGKLTETQILDVLFDRAVAILDVLDAERSEVLKVPEAQTVK